ncbi:zinc metalloprotease HtpX [Barrientosiimonas marina]|uniref:Protease HtpX homolog n=1 Tax=Lentibacillus kimchii TaxID=1542911 RepID=A0ABW2UUW4_9BACI
MLYEQIAQNKRKTMLLVTLFTILVLAIGWAIGYLFGHSPWTSLVVTLIILAIYVPITFMSANSQVLSMSGAKEVTSDDYPELVNIVEELSIAARIPKPKIHVIEEASPNAFATGIKPEKGSVAVTTGLLDKLNREELSGVIAHELGHIRNYDIRLMTICIALVGVIVVIAQFGSHMLLFSGGRGDNQKRNPLLMIVALVLVILAPLAAQFVRLAVSRNREYLADATSVELTRNPAGMISALKKISGDSNDVERADDATAAMYIDVPRKKNRKKRGSLWATHPTIESRIEKLQEM